MDRNKLAALANDLGGLDELADTLGIDNSILESAIKGESLTRFDSAEIDIAYANFEKNNDELYLASIDDTADLLNDSGMLTGSITVSDNLREAFAENRISEQQLGELYTLWGNLTAFQSENVAAWLNSGGGNAELLANLYTNEEDLFGNYEDSDFWEWFRDTFYND
jgi:hypothetical protein